MTVFFPFLLCGAVFLALVYVVKWVALTVALLAKAATRLMLYVAERRNRKREREAQPHV